MEHSQEKNGQYPHVFGFRADAETAENIRQDAKLAGMSPGRFIRQRMQGRHVRAKVDDYLYNEVARLGRMLKQRFMDGLDTRQLQKEISETLTVIRNKI